MQFFEDMFPEGQPSTDGKQFMARDGAYFWPVADIGDNGQWVINELGRALLGPDVLAEKTAPAPTAKPKTKGKGKDALADLDM